jgi:hypothetical protein
MKILILSIVCSAVLGVCVAVFLRFVKYFDKQYEDFEDERYRAAAGPSTLSKQRDAPAKDEEASP